MRLATLLLEELDERVRVFRRVEHEGLFEDHGGWVGRRGDVGCGGGKGLEVYDVDFPGFDDDAVNVIY